MRPRSELRPLLMAAFGETGPATWRQVLPAAGVDARARAEVLLVRRTVENMVRDGELVNVGKQKPANSRRWMTLYEPRRGAGNFATSATSTDDLSGVMRRWSAASSCRGPR